MDISIRSVDEACHVSGNGLEPGCLVRSFLIRNAEGLIDRIDVLEEEKANLVTEGQVLCSWGHRIKEREATEAEEKRAALQSAEDVFLSLYDETGDQPETMLVETRDRLKYFLALQLERKRILKPVGGRKFRHVPSKREYLVPDIEITPELMVRFQEELSLMGGASHLSE